jgi:hypothetical protein
MEQVPDPARQTLTSALVGYFVPLVIARSEATWQSH